MMNNIAARSCITQAIPWLGLIVLGLAATFGVFSGGAMAAIGIGGAVLLFAAVWYADGKQPAFYTDILKLFVVIFGAIGLLNLQAVWPAIAWHQTLQLATILLPLSLLASLRVQTFIAQTPVLKIWPWLLLAGMLALGVELALGNPLQAWLRGEAVPTKYNRGLSYAMLLIWPVLALLFTSGQRKWAALVALAALPLLIFTTSRASQLATMIAVPTLLMAFCIPRVVGWLLGVVVIVMLAWPFAPPQIFAMRPDWITHLPDSWRARMEIWDFMYYHIMERPWLGWGLGSSWKLLPVSPHAAQYIITKGPVGHPHNAFIQLWVELGIPGLILGIALALGSLRAALRLASQLVPFALAAWVVAFVLSMVAYDFWTDSLLAAFALTGFAFALVQRQIKPGFA